MRFPIKINRDRIPSWLHKWLPSNNDPRRLLASWSSAANFESSVTSIKIGTTWKSTRKRRHLISDQLIIKEAFSLRHPLILDVGASAGTTSMELLDRLENNYGRYYVTDLFLDIKCTDQGKVTFFYHPLTSQCIMRVTDWFLMYTDVEGAFPLLGLFATRLIARAPRIDPVHFASISLLHPDLKERAETDPRIAIYEYNVLEPWPHEPVNIIKIANVLNRSYFSEGEIVTALANLKHALKPEGKLVITDNRDAEKVSLFFMSRTGSLIPKKRINGGADIADLAKRV